MSRSEVTVIIPVWNGRTLLETLFERLRAQTWPIAEIVVMDNGSSDGSAEAAECAGARVIRMGRNAGFSRAVNRGIESSRSEWLAIMNTDVEPAADWLERLVEAASQSGAWFATGKILQTLHRDRLDGTFDVLCRGASSWRAGHGRPDGPVFSQRRPIRSAPMTAALFRKELFTRIGSLDERFESYLEDVEFGLRCALAGMAGEYVPEAVAWHVGSATLGAWSPQMVAHISRNQLLLAAKYFPARWIWHIMVAQGLWGLLALRHGAVCAWLGGKTAALREMRSVRRPGVDAKAVRTVVEEGESEIYHIQAKTGFDAYWRWYFFLTRGGTG
jgi:GT2 family glycosyltransferase